jgi:shikimate kinase
MGAGKTTVGRALAGRLRWPFVDLDREIECTAGTTVPELIAERGEDAFRALEHQALRRLADGRRAVIATGGGAFCRPENQDLMRRTGTCVWLDPPLEVLFDRVERSGRARPLFGDRERAAALFSARRPWYEQAHLRVATAGLEAVDEVVDRIVEGLKEPRCAI